MSTPARGGGKPIVAAVASDGRRTRPPPTTAEAHAPPQHPPRPQLPTPGIRGRSCSADHGRTRQRSAQVPWALGRKPQLTARLLLLLLLLLLASRDVCAWRSVSVSAASHPQQQSRIRHCCQPRMWTTASFPRPYLLLRPPSPPPPRPPPPTCPRSHAAWSRTQSHRASASSSSRSPRSQSTALAPAFMAAHYSTSMAMGVLAQHSANMAKPPGRHRHVRQHGQLPVATGSRACAGRAARGPTTRQCSHDPLPATRRLLLMASGVTSTTSAVAASRVRLFK
jgi:hypothetical protein